MACIIRRLLVASALAVAAAVAQAQTSDPAVRALFGKTFVNHVAGTALAGARKEEMHIGQNGEVTVINRLITVSEIQRQRGRYPGYSDAWGSGRLTGRKFTFHHVRDKNLVVACEVASNRLTIHCPAAGTFVRE
jgi:hypothetical protein